MRWFTVTCKPCGKTWGVYLEGETERERLRARAIVAKAWVLDGHRPKCRGQPP